MTDLNLERMIGVLEDSLILNSRDARKRTQLGEAYQKLGRRGEALQNFRRAIKDAPDYAAGHAALGAFLAEDGKWEEGEACLLKATQLKPDLPAPWITLAEEYAKRGSFADASD